jgi:transposase-like protein
MKKFKLGKGVVKMTYNQEERTKAVDRCFELDLDIKKTLSELHYPSYSALYSWVSCDPRFNNLARREYKEKYSLSTRIEALDLCDSEEYNQVQIAEKLNIKTSASISRWKRDTEKNGRISTMNKENMNYKIDPDFIDITGKAPGEIQKIMHQLQLERDAFKAIAEHFSSK